MSFDADSVMWVRDAQAVLWFLVTVAMKSTIVLSVAALVTTLMLRRRSAAMRHLVWLLTLGAVLVMPAAVWVLPTVNVIVPGLPVASVSVDAAPTSADLSDVQRPPQSVHRDSAPALSNESARSLSPSSAPMRQGYSAIRHWPVWLLFIWFAGAACLLARVVLSHLATLKLTRTADAIVEGPLPELLESLRHDLRISRHVALVEGELVGVPTTLGSIKPVILLPTAWRDWTSDRARAVLLHELAHVKRYDCVAQLVGHVACALHWPNPIVWWATRLLLHERERACDDKVLELGTRASDYANDLLEIARDSRLQPSLSLAAVTMARPSQLEGRLLSILDPAVSRTTSMTVRFTTTSSLVVLALGLAVVRPTAAVQVIEPMTEERQPTPAISPDPSLPEAASSAGETAAAVVGTEVATAIRDSIAAAQDVFRDAADRQLDRPDDRQTETPATGQATEVRNRAVLDAFLAALKDTDADIRKDAAWALGQRREPGALDSLLAAIKDESPDVREQVAWALGQWRDARALDALVAALRDMTPDVQQQAAWALGQLRDARAVTPLTSALQAAEDDVREQAAWALGQIRDRQATGALVAALKDAEPNVQQQAAWALGQLRDPSALDGLMAALKASDAEVRQEAAWALGQLRDDRATDALVALTRDSDAEIRRTALRALAELGDLKNRIGSGGNPNPNPNPDPDPNPDPNPLPKPRPPR